MNQCTMCKKDVGDVNERDLHCPKMEWITIRSQLCFIRLLIIYICACYIGCGSQKSHQNAVPLPVKVTRPTQAVVQQTEKNPSYSIERSKQSHDALQAHIQQAGLLTQPSLQNNASQIIAILFIPASKSSRLAHGHVCFTLVDSAPATRGIALCQLWPYTRVAAMLLYSSNI